MYCYNIAGAATEKLKPACAGMDLTCRKSLQVVNMTFLHHIDLLDLP